MAIPSASLSDTEGKDNVDEEIYDEVLLIEEHNFLFTAFIFRDREATSSPCLYVHIVRYRAAYI